MIEFTGNTFFSNTVFFLSVFIAVFFILSVVFAVFYHRFLYTRFIRARYDSSYKPSALIVLPCKGQPKDFKDNIISFFRQDYSEYRVVFSLESREDTAFPVVKEVLNEFGRRQDTYVIAGKTDSGCQKNHNLVAAIDAYGRDHEVYVFADSDIKISRNWLSELVLPLSDERICVSTGFRWLYSVNKRVGEITNSYQNILLMSLFTVSSFLKNIGLWGGSMAIRKREFNELGVREYWKKTVVDDMSLSRLVMKSKRKSVMVSTCITDTGDALPTFSKSLNWFTRQVMFLKAYQGIQWYQGIAASLVILFFTGMLPAAFVITFFTDLSFADTGGWGVLVYWLAVYGAGIFFPLLGTRSGSLKFFLLQPILLLSVALSVFKTLFKKSILWSGYKYTLDSQGIVISIEDMA